MFGKKVISEVKIVVIFEGGQSKVKRAVLWAAETWRDDCQSTWKIYGQNSMMLLLKWNLVARAFAGCYHLIFLIIEFLYFFFFGCPPSKVKVKYLYSATRFDAFASYVVHNIYIFFDTNKCKILRCMKWLNHLFSAVWLGEVSGKTLEFQSAQTLLTTSNKSNI